jgi:hypothetical protein
VGHLLREAGLRELHELRVHDDQVHAERLARQCRGRRDLRRELIGIHRAAGDHAEAAGVGDRRDQIALRHPGHGAAHDRGVAAEEFLAASPQTVELSARLGAVHRHYAASRP